jgi:hypothetical protein
MLGEYLGSDYPVEYGLTACPNGVKLSLHWCKIAAWRGQGSR